MTYQREDWQPGEQAWFEYHCFESPLSSDAELWYHSQQPVTVLGHLGAPEVDCFRDSLPTAEERGFEGMPCMYRLRFEDGFEYDVFEDEVLTSPDGYTHEPPPEVLTNVA